MIEDITGKNLMDIYTLEVPSTLSKPTAHQVQISIDGKSYLIDNKYFSGEWLEATNKLMENPEPSYKARINWLVKNWRKLEVAMLPPSSDTPEVSWFV